MIIKNTFYLKFINFLFLDYVVKLKHYLQLKYYLNAHIIKFFYIISNLYCIRKNIRGVKMSKLYKFLVLLRKHANSQFHLYKKKI